MGKAKQGPSAVRQFTLASGVVRFSRSKKYHKKALYKFTKKTTPKAPSKAKPTFVEKPIGGAQNGGKRMVRVKKLRNDYPTSDRTPRRSRPKGTGPRVHKFRPSLAVGTVAVVLAGLHRGKRVIVLKHLPSGLLLVTGPYKINGCPLRRVNQRYVLATSTRIDISSVKLPEKLNDAYFRRATKAAKGPAKKEGDIFEKKKEEYKVSAERKEDQDAVDKQVLEVIKKHEHAVDLKDYLGKAFALRKGQFPHRMQF